MATVMALIKIYCARCGHKGFAVHLPRLMRCVACNHQQLFYQGVGAVRAHLVEESKPYAAERAPGGVRAVRRKVKTGDEAQRA
jgi:hypothetical protein